MEYMNHLILLGDSIFDNAAYVAGGLSVIEQVKNELLPDWRATLLAVDGDTTSDVPLQLKRMPSDTTHVVLSIGGNDALGCIASLEAPATSVRQALVPLNRIKTEFQDIYKALHTELAAMGIPLMACTIYDAVPGLPPELRTALGMFNDVIIAEAAARGLPLLDLRLICTDAGDYSAESPIEPSSQGGAKLAKSLVGAVMRHDFRSGGCRIYA
jgi:lysophospholipase L1-like esterase